MSVAVRCKRSMVVLVVLVLTVCSSVSAKVPITVWLSGTPASMSEWAQQFQDDFNAANPDIELSLVIASWPQVREQVFVAAVGGSGPDISYLSGNILSLVIENKFAQPIDGYWNKMPDKSDFVPDIVSALQYKGQTYGVPFMMWPLVDYYNLDVMDNSGVAQPKDWDSLVSAARKMTRYGPDNNIDVFGFRTFRYSSGYVTYDLHVSLEQLGSKLIDMGDTQVEINNPTGRKALQYLADLWQAGMPPGIEVNKLDEYENLIKGKTGVLHLGEVTLMSRDLSGQRIEPHRYVGPTAGTDVVQHNSGVLYMLRTTKHPDEAWRVMEAFISQDNLMEYNSQMGTRFPVRRSLFPKVSAMYPNPMAAKLLDTMYSPITTLGARHTYFTEFHRASGDILMSALRGETGLEAALEETESLINAILDEKFSLADK